MRDLEDIMWMQAIDMLERAERLQRRFFQPTPSGRQPAWQPPMDVFESSGGLQIVVALPGVSPEEVQVIFSGNVLTDNKVSSWISRIPLILRFEQFPRFTKYHPE